jgi:Peptidase inhibitor I9
MVTLAAPLHPELAQGQTRNQRPRVTRTTKFRKVLTAAPGQYIVMLRQDTPRSQVSALASALTRKHGGVVEYIYTDIFKGFSVKEMSEAQARALSRQSSVTSVEESARLQVTGQEYWPEESGVIKPLDRIDQRSGELDA